MDKAIETLRQETEDGLVLIDAYYENEEPDFDYGDEEQNRAEMSRFESGELLNLNIVVTVYDLSGQVEGMDSLGQCFVNASDALNDIQQIVADYRMVEEAYSHLERRLAQIRAAN
tara:strand:- start:3809 stop:4153 length:345 start_codon:yes stop_codon:yes gene_type:complete